MFVYLYKLIELSLKKKKKKNKVLGPLPLSIKY